MAKLPLASAKHISEAPGYIFPQHLKTILKLFKNAQKTLMKSLKDFNIWNCRSNIYICIL